MLVFPPLSPARPPPALRAGPAAGRGSQARLAADRAAAGEEEEPPAGRAPSAEPGAEEGSGISQRCLEGEAAGEGAAPGPCAPSCIVPPSGSRSRPRFLRGGGAAGPPSPEASVGSASAPARQAPLWGGKAAPPARCGGGNGAAVGLGAGAAFPRGTAAGRLTASGVVRVPQGSQVGRGFAGLL